MKVVTVDFDISSKSKISWGNKFVVLINVLVLSTFQEFTFQNTGVLLCWLEDLDGIIGKEEANNESSVDIFRNSSIESCSESEHFLIIIDVLKEVSLWLVWKKFVYVTK